MSNVIIKVCQQFTRHLYGQLSVALFLGVIQVFAFAPFTQWWVIFPSIVGMFLLLERVAQTTKRYFLVSFVFSWAFFIATIHWVYVSMDLFGGMPSIVSVALILLLTAYLAIYPALALFFTKYCYSLPKSLLYLLFLPTFWLVSDYLRGVIMTGFPWAYLGYTQMDTPLVGFAPILGVQGITLAVIVICGAITLLLKKQMITLNVTVILTILVSGHLLSSKKHTEHLPAIDVRIVQGNIDQNKKWLPEHFFPSYHQYLTLSNGPQPNQKPELIIWPESAIAALETDLQRHIEPLSILLEEQNKTLLTGIIGYDLVNKDFYNTIIALGKLPDYQGYAINNHNRYQKHQLLPIGEFVPFEDLLRPLAPYFNLPMSSFQRGARVQRNLQVPGAQIASALCYEIAFPELLRENITDQTGLILTLSNDAWFGDSIGPTQHLQIARMRAIEFARPVLRSTNNGFTAIFDDQGNTVAQLPVNVADVLIATINPSIGVTPYQRLGNTPLYGFCLFGFLLLVIYRRKGNTNKSSNS